MPTDDELLAAVTPENRVEFNRIRQLATKLVTLVKRWPDDQAVILVMDTLLDERGRIQEDLLNKVEQRVGRVMHPEGNK